jgi:hypothetical protein
MSSKRIDPAVRAEILQFALAFPEEKYETVAEVCGVPAWMVGYVMRHAGFHRRACRRRSRRVCGCNIPNVPCIVARLRNALRRLVSKLLLRQTA